MIRKLNLLLLSIVSLVGIARGDAIGDRLGALESRVAGVESRLGIAPPTTRIASVDGWTRVADENATVDVGPTPVGVAYGAAGSYLTRTLSGRVVFANATFGGDPALGVRKGGYVLRVPASPATAPATPPPTTRISEVPARRTIELAITDGVGTPAANKPYLDACGLEGERGWIGVNWTTGRANGRAAIDRLNAWAAAGYAVVATVTPDELGERKGPACADWTACVPDLLLLDPRVVIQLGNEFNRPNYGFANGDFAAGYRAFTLPIAKRIKSIDPRRQLATASIVWQTPAFHAQQWEPLIAETPAGLFSYLALNDYTLDPRNFDDVLAAGQAIAARLGCELMVPEWGAFDGTGTDGGARLAAVLPQLRASIRARAAIAAFFIAPNQPKFAQRNIAYLYDVGTGATTPVYRAMVDTARTAKLLYFNAGFEPAFFGTRCPPGYRLANVAGDSYVDASGQTTSYWQGGYGGPRQTPDPARLAAAARTWPDGMLVVLDELPGYDLDGRDTPIDTPATVARNVAWSTGVKTANPRLLVANYNAPPLRAHLYEPMLVWRGEQAWAAYLKGGTTMTRPSLATVLVAALLAPTARAADLHSRPGAAHAIYLDMDGAPASQWTGYEYVPPTPAYTGDSLAVWRRATELFAGYDVDVTTASPPDALTPGRDIEVVIGGNLDWSGTGSAGLAIVNAYDVSWASRVCYVASDLIGDPTWIANAAAHEVGHVLGMQHQTDSRSIMYEGGPYAPGVTWVVSDGQDDRAILARRLGVVPEPAGLVVLAMAGCALIRRRRA